jgi:hypothetical protein
VVANLKCMTIEVGPSVASALQDSHNRSPGGTLSSQAEFRRDASLHHEPGIAPIGRAFEHTCHDHVRDPGADTSFADACLRAAGIAVRAAAVPANRHQNRPPRERCPPTSLRSHGRVARRVRAHLMTRDTWCSLNVRFVTGCSFGA